MNTPLKRNLIMASQRPAGTDRSASALGWSYKKWTRNDLGLILGHYGVPFAAGDSKTMSIRSLNQLAAQRGLTREDRLAIINADKTGLRLPPRKPLVQASTAPPAILQAVAIPPSIFNRRNTPRAPATVVMSTCQMVRTPNKYHPCPMKRGICEGARLT